jgi:exonuclease III
VEALLPEAGVTVIGLYAPLKDSLGSSPMIQRQFWTVVRAVMEARQHERIVVLGDFNIGAAGSDCPSPVSCMDVFPQLSASGWIDAWARCNPGRGDFSYVHRSKAGRSLWRIDHAFVSPALAPAVRSCRYSHSEREQGLSDHSMLIMEID